MRLSITELQIFYLENEEFRQETSTPGNSKGTEACRDTSCWNLRTPMSSTGDVLCATRRGPVLSYQLLHTPELGQMEMSALRSLWKPWLGRDHSGFCVGLIREVDRPLHIHPDTSCCL
ncbi:hypothetical protein CapIbe_006980 [Capra ibex]